MEKFHSFTAAVSSNPRVVWFVTLLTLMALAVAAGAPEVMSCAGLMGC